MPAFSGLASVIDLLEVIVDRQVKQRTFSDEDTHSPKGISAPGDSLLLILRGQGIDSSISSKA
jgi:hypothetical protein